MIPTKPNEIKVCVLVLLLFIVSAALAEALFAIRFHPTGQGSVTGQAVRLRDAAASAKPWPSSTPHTTPWPAPMSWELTTAFGQRHYDVRADNPSSVGGNGFTMDLTLTGWPLPVLETKKMWWDWDDPALQGPPPYPPTRVIYVNILLNALIIGLALWFACIFPITVWIARKRRFWAKRGRCSFCGYQVDNLPACPECGEDNIGLQSAAAG